MFYIFGIPTTAVIFVVNFFVTIGDRSKRIKKENQLAHSLLNEKVLDNLWLLDTFLKREEMEEMESKEFCYQSSS